MRSPFKTLGVIAVAMSVLTLPATAATLNIQENGAGTDDDVLLGFNNLDIAGTKYNVLFKDGTCIALFAGCDASSDFTFQTFASAQAAAQGMLDAVKGTYFENNPQQVFGITSDNFADVFVPFDIVSTTGPGKLGGPATTETSVVYTGFTFPGTFNGTSYPLVLLPQRTLRDSDSTTGNDFLVYAEFSAIAAVPLPASMPMLLAGLVGFSALRRRKARAA